MKKSILLMGVLILFTLACKKDDPKPAPPTVEPKFQYYWKQRVFTNHINMNGCMTEKEMQQRIANDSAYGVVKSGPC